MSNMFPIFFSVSSTDIAFAEEVSKKLPDDWIYLYSKTGEEGAHMWDEISHKELPQSQIFIIFWSKSYIAATGCVREILQAKDLVQKASLKPLVLRLDDTPITWQDDHEEDGKPVFEALGTMLQYRTSSPKVTVQQAIDLVERVAEPILRSDHPRMPRHDLQQTLSRVVKKDRFTYYPATWVSGFNGVGRETLIRDFSRSFTPNGRGFVIEVNEASLPKQTWLRIESQAFGADHERLKQLNDSVVIDEIKAVADTIERVFAAGDYVILRHSRIVEDRVDLPGWLDDVVNALSPATRPKLFIISQIPLLAERRARCRVSISAQRVPAIEEHQLTEFCYQLIGYFDKNPGRWDDEEIQSIVHASGGSVGFLVSLVRAASGMEDFDQIDKLVAADSHNMAASITTYVRWAFSQLRDFEDEQRTLLFLNDVSPCDIIDLEKAISPKRSMFRVLGKLLELGLIERESESLYRLTPLLANRLNRDLIRPSLLVWQREALVGFLKEPIEIYDNENSYLRIESRIQASLLAQTDELPNGVANFVSAAHWFQAGIRLYHARHRESAYRLLKKAYLKRAEFVTASRVELIRYFCLSATRNRKYEDAEKCIILLDNVHQTRGMASFLRADMFEYKGNFPQAVKEYKRSIQINEGKDHRLERTYRPLIRCLLALSHPDFVETKNYAIKWLKLRQTIFSLKALPRVYLHWKYRDPSSAPADINRLYSNALADLERDPGVGSAHFELKAEEAEFSGDFDGAVDYMEKAIETDPRFELRSERWRLMAKSGVLELANRAIDELEAARNDSKYRDNWLPFLPALAEIYAIALKITKQSYGALNTFSPQLSSDEIGHIIARVKRLSLPAR
ncbi:hypothetical protein AAC691_09315 [Nguyenibacter vanlangensis]|uniref:TIR domain-containing protein n=1 Tax=Nguyenibacter vanlangensis TaxID=1216886 RepID=A0ABZ3DAJ5_9PROT